jgi:uncharacterized metal-binding protein YceD (DUF177 family)
MVLAFRKVSNYPSSLNFNEGGIEFEGEIEKVSAHTIQLCGTLRADIEVECNRCASAFHVTICEDLQLNITDTPSLVEDLDTIECLNGEIDIASILLSEVQAYKSDYIYCSKCDGEDEFEIEI